MKKLIFILSVLFGVVSCGHTKTTEVVEDTCVVDSTLVDTTVVDTIIV